MCGKSIPLRETHTHLEDCDGACVPCPNMCLRSDSAQNSSSALNDVTFIRRKDIEAHRVDCPFEVVSCPFRAVGCSVQNEITRIDLADHMSSAMQSHLVLLLKNLGKGIAGSSDGGRRKRGYHDGLEDPAGIPCKKARVNGMVPDSSTHEEEGDPITELLATDMGTERSNEMSLSTMADQLKTLISLKEEVTPLGSRVVKCEERMNATENAMDESKFKQDNDFNAVRAHLKKLDDRFAALNGEARKTAQTLRKFREDMVKRVDAGDASLRGTSARCKSLADDNDNLKATVLSFREQADAGNSVTNDCLHAIKQLQDDVQRLRALLPRESEATRGDLESKDAATYRDPEVKVTFPSSAPEVKHALVHRGHESKDAALPIHPASRSLAPLCDPNSKFLRQCDRPEAEKLAEPAESGSKVLALTHTQSCTDASGTP
jgi:predicted  nucleic acid-binding Zn-ribbon protein